MTMHRTPLLRMTRTMRVGTALLKRLLQAGLPMGPLVLLRVRGRTSGKIHTTPVALVRQDQEWWLVAAFGEVNWVRNLRVAEGAQLTRGRHAEHIGVEELSPSAAAPILQQFLRAYRWVPFIPPYFGVTTHASRAAFEQEAAQHPVFHIVPAQHA